MTEWTVELCDAFEPEFEKLKEAVQDELLANAQLLEQFGPNLGRPWADTLKGSAFSNMKELRFRVGGEVWRVAFAFDPKRNAILLVAGDKAGKDQKRFYKKFLKSADQRYSEHLKELGDK